VSIDAAGVRREMSETGATLGSVTSLDPGLLFADPLCIARRKSSDFSF